MKISQKATIGLAAALVIAGGTASIAVAANSTQTPSSSGTPQRAVAAVAAKAQNTAPKPAVSPSVVPTPGTSPISQAQAVQAALAQSPGAVLESAKLDANDNYWEIDLKPGQGQTQHVDYKIDAASGAVRSVETDSSHMAPAPAPAPGTPAPATPAPAAPAPAAPAKPAPAAPASHEGHTPAQEQAHQAKEQSEQAKDLAEKAQEKTSGNHPSGKDD